MRKEVRWIFWTCLLVITGVLCLQAFWVRNFYELNRDRFEKEVNLAFEDAIKKEFTLRNDSIQSKLTRFLMDTSEIRIRSKVNSRNGQQMYLVINVHDTTDYYSFSRKELDFPIRSQHDPNRGRIALAAARLDREEDLDHHIIFYRTQNVGKFLQQQADVLSFDTARLRPILRQTLRQRDIKEHFVFSLKDSDNTLNHNRFPDSLTRSYPVITKAFPTFRNLAGENYVRAYFVAPSGYIFSRTFAVIAGSAVLFIVVALAFFYLVRVINREKKLSAVKNDFINHITHEFKTPIATVYSAVEALDSFGMASDPERAKKYLRISRTELERLSELVTKVLQISLYERPEHEIRKEPVDFAEIVTRVIQALRLAAEHHEIRFDNSAGNSWVKGDATHLYNSVSNLLDNAIKYSSAPAKVQVSLYNEERMLVLSVKDEGFGIRKEYQEFIFDKFYRAPEPAIQQSKGFGLGLSYTRDVIGRHQGWCRVQSEWGAGSIFTIALPVSS